MGWLGTWKYRVPITVDKDRFDASLSDFPVLVHLSASCGQSSQDLTVVFDKLGGDAARKKIAVTTDDGETQCYVEIEPWDHANEDAWLYVKMPTTPVSTGSDGTLYLYYDVAHDDNTSYVGDTGEAAAQGVWDANFAFVAHKGQDPTGGAGAIKDSTSNGIHGTAANMEAEDLVAGKAGKALDFDGSNEKVSHGTDSELQPVNTVTVEAVIYPHAVSDMRTIAQYGKAAGHSYGLGINVGASAANKLVFSFHNGSWRTVADADDCPANDWSHAAGRYDGSTLEVFRQGVSKNSTSYSGNFNYTSCDGLNVGAYYVSGYTAYFDGPICEVRVSKIARPDAWIKATYYTLFDDMMTFGAAETSPREVSDGAGLGDTVEADAPGREVSESAGLGDEVDVQGPVAAEAADSAGLGDEVDVQVEFDASIEDSAGLGDAAARHIEAYEAIEDSAGLADEAEIFNWTEWLEQNRARAIRRFYFTLTGAADGETDLEIPISSFQCRHRSGDPTYLSVVIPDLDTYGDAVNARPNGEMVIEMAYILDGEESLREEIVRVDLEEIRTDEGAGSKSITLTGHRTTTYSAKNVPLWGVSTRVLSGAGKLKLRADPDLYVKPGDNITYEEDEFTAGLVSYIITPVQHIMEVTEA